MNNDNIYSCKEFYVGGIYKNRTNDEYEILEITERNPLKYKIKFINSNYTTILYAKGYIKDYLKPSVFNVGYMGYATSKNNIKIYNLWHNMLCRCYNKNSKDYVSYGNIGVKVYDRWLNFENFCNDLEYIEGYNYEQFINGEIVLDKDYKQQNKPEFLKYYSLETCCFISKELNQSLRNTYNYKTKFQEISPDGSVRNIDIGIAKYARIMHMDYSGIKDCLEGKRESYNGYKYYKIIMTRCND